MKLSIVTINYNNAEGLRKTLASVASQTYADIEHVIVDGGSTDGSVAIIEAYASDLASKASGCVPAGGEGCYAAVEGHDSTPANGAQPLATQDSTSPKATPPHKVTWISEKDKGIYNAMNKGIRMATGEYIEILNSGDILFDANVTQRMIERLDQINSQREENVGILYGNMIKVNSAGKVVGKSEYTEYSLRQFYSSTLNHDCAYIRRDLFEEYGLYDEQLKIVSDWKWYLQAIGLGNVKPEYVDIDVTIFDDGGISETNLTLRNAERRKVLEEVLPPAVLWDYDTHAFEMEQMKRLRRWKLYGLVYLLERTLFKLEKWGVLRQSRTMYDV
jgi:glycosyltransferase involved in cell wall biosynthesis